MDSRLNRPRRAHLGLPTCKCYLCCALTAQDGSSDGHSLDGARISFYKLAPPPSRDNPSEELRGFVVPHMRKSNSSTLSSSSEHCLVCSCDARKSCAFKRLDSPEQQVEDA